MLLDTSPQHYMNGSVKVSVYAYMAHIQYVAAYYKQPVFHTLKVTLHHTNSPPLVCSLLFSVSRHILIRVPVRGTAQQTRMETALTHTLNAKHVFALWTHKVDKIVSILA